MIQSQNPKVCPKCQYQRRAEDIAPEWQCPNCQIAYRKYEAAQAIETSAYAPQPTSGLNSSAKSYSCSSGKGIGTLLVYLMILTALATGGYYAFDRFTALPGQGEVLIYTTNNCPPCTDALAYLDQQEADYREINIEDSAENRKSFDRYNKGTLPLVFIDGERVDGFNPMLLDIFLTGFQQRQAGIVDQEVIMYSAKGCGYCTKAQNFLADKGIDYIEYDIAEAEAQSEYDRLGGRGTPLIFIGGVRMDGFNAQAMEMALKQIDLL